MYCSNREDYLVEAMEMVEMYCDLLLARFGLITQMKELDTGIAEPVASLVWVCPRLQSDIAELKIISDIFVTKYGPQFAEQSRTATGEHFVSEKLMHKLTLQAPPKLLSNGFQKGTQNCTSRFHNLSNWTPILKCDTSISLWLNSLMFCI